MTDSTTVIGGYAPLGKYTEAERRTRIGGACDICKRFL